MALYSITSSATASMLGGMVRRSALAIFRLITSSNLLNCTIEGPSLLFWPSANYFLERNDTILRMVAGFTIKCPLTERRAIGFNCLFQAICAAGVYAKKP